MKSADYFRVAIFSLLISLPAIAAAQSSNVHELDAFNQRFTDAIRHMDNAAVLSLWADDGVSLLPNTAPILGKSAIEKFMNDVTSRTKGYSVISHEK